MYDDILWILKIQESNLPDCHQRFTTEGILTLNGITKLLIDFVTVGNLGFYVKLNILSLKLSLCNNLQGWAKVQRLVSNRHSAKNSYFLYLVLCAEQARKNLNKETKNFSRFVCNLRSMKTSLKE